MWGPYFCIENRQIGKIDATPPRHTCSCFAQFRKVYIMRLHFYKRAYLPSTAQWAKKRKKISNFKYYVFGWLPLQRLPQILKFMFFEKISSLRVSFRDPLVPLENFSKNVDFSLWGDHATTQTHIWNWNFFHIFASAFFFRHRYILVAYLVVNTVGAHSGIGIISVY